MYFLGPVLRLAALLQLASANFIFTFQLDSISTRGNCFGDDLSLPCETYLAIFCLRAGPRGDFSTSTSDCSLGTSGRIGPSYDPPVMRQITSAQTWTGEFQMFVLARDEDEPASSDDDIDDIFINSSLQPNAGSSPARSYTGRSNKVTIQMKFRVICDRNFYGLNCTTFCLAQDDDVNGHYTCNNDGSLRCRSGFEHPENNCRDRITACSSGPCEHGAPCTPIGFSDYSCQCPPGYTGRNCELNINDCDPNPCENGGNCTDALASYSCACSPGFSGMNCNIDINECEEMGVDCPGNTTCVDGVNSYSCAVCNEAGNCTVIDPCDSNPCASGCSCTSTGSFDHQCLCPSTDSGPDTTWTGKHPEGVSAALVGGVVGGIAALILVFMSCLIMVIILVLHKKRKTKPTTTSENGAISPGTQQTPDDDIELKQNIVYGFNPTKTRKIELEMNQAYGVTSGERLHQEEGTYYVNEGMGPDSTGDQKH